MKYGRLVFARSVTYSSTCNLGDIVQTFAIDLIYQKMGVSADDIINISVEELGSYRGEEVILPIDGYFKYSKACPAFPTSKYIRPVFLGVHAPSREYLGYSKFWSANGPIGCRDEATASAMRKRGYDAYLTGCMTVLFPKRASAPKQPHVFVVDAHPAVFKYIPENLKQYAEFVSQEIKIDPSEDTVQAAANNEAATKRLYRRYRDEATLVITSRLHCAAPCIAMGIPTIVVKNGFDSRFGWIDKFVHLYTTDEFDAIDWNPAPVDLEPFKERLCHAAISMVKLDADRDALARIHGEYMSRERKKLSTPFLVQAHMWLAQYAPGLASWIREKLLYRFTIANMAENGRRGGVLLTNRLYAMLVLAVSVLCGNGYKGRCGQENWQSTAGFSYFTSFFVLLFSEQWTAVNGEEI